jgi:hypothetical protein
MDKKRELLTLTPGDDAEGRIEVSDDDDDGMRTSHAITSPCDSVLGY